MNRPMLFAPKASAEFGRRVAAACGCDLSPIEEREFEGGEHKTRPLVSVRGRDVYVVQSLSGDAAASANDRLCRLLYIYLIIGIGWLAQLWLVPEQATSWEATVERASIGPIPGSTVIMIVILFYIMLIVMSIATVGLQHAAGEVLPRYGSFSENFTGRTPARDDIKTDTFAWYRPSRRRKQLLTLIITDHAQAVSKKIIDDMNRGVTSMSGVGMFTGKSHQVLLCALTVSEVPQLKALVQGVDPNAFVVVSPAQEVFGRGFMPLGRRASLHSRGQSSTERLRGKLQGLVSTALVATAVRPRE